LRARNSWATCRLNLKIWDRCFAKASILRKPGPPVNSFPPTCPVPEAHSMNLWQVGYLLRFEVGGGRCCIRSKSIREIAHNLKGSAQHRSQSFGVPVRHRLLSAAGSAASELGDWKGELAAGAEHWQCCTRTADTDPVFEGYRRWATTAATMSCRRYAGIWNRQHAGQMAEGYVTLSFTSGEAYRIRPEPRSRADGDFTTKDDGCPRASMRKR
jgi:hypothetical protein